MSEAEALSRKKKMRGAHRSSVTRMITQVEELLRAEPEELNVSQLKQKRQALVGKTELLTKLDEEILTTIEEDGLEDEVEQADLVRERIELTIINLDSALNEVSLRTHKSPKPTNGHERTTESHSSPPGEHTSTRSSTPSDPGSHTNTPIPSRSPTPPLTGGRSPRVKLPKLSLKKFNGDLTRWTTFWDTFESAVHSNPSLTNIDKFNYLNSLLESAASDAISGLTLTSANYEEAIGVLKKRFGNKQLIVNRHMDLLLNLDTVTSQHDLKGLRKLYDVVESNVRGLRALGVQSSSYGGLLTPVLISKLPTELRLIISRELKEGEWEFESMMEVVEREVAARERSIGALSQQARKLGTSTKPPPTALSLVTGTSNQITCAYCNQPHTSNSCPTVTNPEERKRVLRTTGRCFICLKRHHISRNCRSSVRCNNCRGRHHTSICTSSSSRTEPTNPANNVPAGSHSATNAASVNVATSTSLQVNCQTPILLQTARAIVCDASQEEPAPKLEVRAILDLGSQRSYVTTRVREALKLRKVRSESMIIKTFGSDKGDHRACDIVELKMLTKDYDSLTISTIVVPHICDPVQMQPISPCKDVYQYLSNLELADSGDSATELQIDILIGSDHYWKLVTGRVVKGPGGPTAIETKIGWVLSGPVEGGIQETTMVNFVTTRSTHSLRVDAITEQESLDSSLRRFWDLETLGILKDETSVYEKFTQQITLRRGRYEVHLPWKESHPYLPDNYELCRKRLYGLLKRLRQNPEQLVQYDTIINDQLRQGVVEVVRDPAQFEGGRVHYLPHHPVIRLDKDTTKLRIVYDASAKMDGPCLNDCLYTGPKFSQNILDILLRFRLNQIALIGDVEKAFLMISVADCDRDVLRFLWVRDPKNPQSEVTVMRFTRVVFGVSASPFLLNATLDHHMAKFESVDRQFVHKFRRSVYVDDLASGAQDIDGAYEFYIKSKLRLAEASFNLRKFDSNSPELRQRIAENEQSLCQDPSTTKPQSHVDDLHTEAVERQVLGVRWNVTADHFIFDVSDIYRLMKDTKPTKRNAVSLATRFFDPLGVISPITVRFKLLFQRLCESKTSWDEPLTGALLAEWESLSSDLEQSEPIVIPRYCIGVDSSTVKGYLLQGFCDASQRAYAAVLYLRVETEVAVHTHLLCSKTRIAPVKGVTIPRLELLSALLLARLVSTARSALEPDIHLDKLICFTDSKVALYWIVGEDKEWKQFIQNRVTEIRSLVPAANWRHCPGIRNPADIPSRGVSAAELQDRMDLWLHGPLCLEESTGIEKPVLETFPKECLMEMKTKDREKVSFSMMNSNRPAIVPCEDYSTLQRLLRVTAYVLKFIRLVRKPQRSDSQQSARPSTVLCAEDMNAAMSYWLKTSQSTLPDQEQFPLWTQQFGLFKDSDGVWRCGGRLGNSEVPLETKHPVFLDKNHHLTSLIVRDCHTRVKHGGVKATLTELRSRYWIVKGRNLVRKTLHKCVTCRRFQSKPYCPPPAPPLPSFRVRESRPFSFTGVDFAGPLYVWDKVASLSRKTWICLYTCCATRAVHLDLVPDMTAPSFIRSFKRFTSRRGFPVRIVSDNAKTFKSAAKMITTILESAEVQQHFTNVNIKWSFNLEKAPWWGGLFERMIQSAKRCLRKTIGNAKLTHDELLTSVVEVEMILNSRPLSYVSSEEYEEPLTPSHLLLGFRVLSLPDIVTGDGDTDTDYDSDITHDDLTKRMKHLSRTLDMFWRRWKMEYLLELRESHRHSPHQRGTDDHISVGDIVIVHDENYPRGLWKLGKIESLLPGTDGNVRGAFVRVHSSGQHSILLKRPIQRLYPLEVRASEEMSSSNPSVDADMPTTPPLEETSETNSVALTPGTPRPRRQASRRARDKIKTWVDDMNADDN